MCIMTFQTWCKGWIVDYCDGTCEYSAGALGPGLAGTTCESQPVFEAPMYPCTSAPMLTLF